MKLSFQSTGIISQLKTASISFLTSSTPLSPPAVGGGSDGGGVLRELITWPFKCNIEEPSIVLYPCLHLVITSERNFTRRSFSFDQTLSTWFAVSPATPAAVVAAAMAVVTFNLKADWNWLAVTGTLSLQVQMRGENLDFITSGMYAVKLHTAMWCCLMYS